MAILLFRLANVPYDEANDIREILSENQIQFYETDAGFFRVGVDAIWLPNAEKLDLARQLLSEYQMKRSREQKDLYNLERLKGHAPSNWKRISAHPFRFLAVSIAVLMILGIVILPFIYL